MYVSWSHQWITVDDRLAMRNKNSRRLSYYVFHFFSSQAQIMSTHTWQAEHKP